MSRLYPTVSEGTTVVGSRVSTVDCSHSIVVNTSKRSIAVAGLDNIVVIATEDAVLAVSRRKLPEIKTYLAAIKNSRQLPRQLF